MQAPNTISQKCRYALRAIFELAMRDTAEPVKTQDVAAAQAIPVRFLEVIMAELKHAGFVVSKRGNDGGYMLARAPKELTVGEVIDFLQGSSAKGTKAARRRPALVGDYAFSAMWQEVTTAITNAYNSITFADLVRQEMTYQNRYVSNYTI